jgi:hypothetical protein
MLLLVLLRTTIVGVIIPGVCIAALRRGFACLLVITLRLRRVHLPLSGHLGLRVRRVLLVGLSLLLLLRGCVGVGVSFMRLLPIVLSNVTRNLLLGAFIP